MTFIEAVQALKAGRCEAISREIWDKTCRSFVFRNNGHGTLVNGHGSGPVQVEHILADDWIMMFKHREEVELNLALIECLKLGGKTIPLKAKFYAEWVE